MNLTLNKKLQKEIEAFCELNEIEDVDGFLLEVFEKGFNVERYGIGPFNKGGDIIKPEPEIIEKEIIKEVEIIKEIPVEKIIEVVKEVPVEKIVEKEIFITDDSKYDELVQKMQKLESIYKATKNDYNSALDELSGKTEQLEKLEEEIKKLKVVKPKIKEEPKDERDNDIYGEYM